MYILVKKSIPLGLAMNSAAHASLACFREYEDNRMMQAWIDSPHFRKATCWVDDNDFEKAKTFDKHIVMTENSLGGEETAIAFCPREEWPKFFNFLQLYGKGFYLTEKIDVGF